MINRVFRWTGVGLAATALAGCANVPRDAGFSDVQNAVATRTHQLVQWRGHTADDAAADAVVRAALQRELTSDDAVRIALLNNLNLQATYQDLGVAQADLVQAGLLRNPVLSLERRLPGHAVEVSVVGDFLDLFFIPLRKRIAGAAFEAAKWRVADAVLNTATQTRQALYTLQGAMQIVEMRRSVVLATSLSADMAKRLRDAGNITRLSLREEQKLAAEAKLDLARAQAEVTADRERLNVLMGLWGDNTDWTIAPHLPPLPPVEPPQRGLESLAISQRLDLSAARESIEASAQSLHLADASRFVPGVNVGAHFDRETDGTKSIGPVIELPIPLFDQGQASVARGDALLQQARWRYAALAIDIRSQVRAAYARMISDRQQVEYYQYEVLPLAEDITEQTQLQYNAMQIGAFQLLQAKRSQIDAGRESIDALRDYWIARTELERALGGRLPSTGVPATQPTHPAPTTKTAPPEHHHGD